MMKSTEYPWIKIFSITRPKPSGFEQYFQEINSLGNEFYEILDQGKKWSKELVSVLNDRGGVIFPHTFFSKCGEQIGAVVHAILDSGADEVILLGTAHQFPQLWKAKVKEFNGENISNEPSWGILNPDSLDHKNLLKDEFSLNLFKSVLEMEAERRNVKVPRLIERYPSLVNRDPNSLPGIKELQKTAKNAIIVGTEDYCHHGIAYAVSPQTAIPIGEKALEFARNQIEEGFNLLEQNNYSAFYEHGMSLNSLGDPSDVTATIHYLVGSQAKPRIVNLKLVDVSNLFENDPSPSWVAATLATITKA